MTTGWVRDSRGRRAILRNAGFLRRALWAGRAGYRRGPRWTPPYDTTREYREDRWAWVWRVS